MTLRLYIVDDEALARARLKMLLSDIAAQCPHQLVGEADNAATALAGIGTCRPDVVLLDVQMPGMTGIELAARLAAQPAAPAVIFVTAYDEYALKAFEVHAFDYLLKPVRAARLAEALERVQGLRLAQQEGQSGRPQRQHFTVQERGRLLLVPVADVLYLRAELKYVTLHTRSRDYLIEASLVSLEEELAASFVRVHRNTLVARDAIIGVERGALLADAESGSDKPQESWQVILRDVEERLPVSRRQWPLLKALVR
jgi:two-component system, LytTR family, response regulator AlgR